MNKRVHGEIHIRRQQLTIDNWEKHKSELVEDFHNICGYCGKDFFATRSESQIDHFIPKKKYPEYENEYENLVLACKVCNNKKRQDWPSGDPTKRITDDNTKGYVDPASDEYDHNLIRNDDGSIIGITPVGRYIAERLCFDSRPIKECYKIAQLKDLTKELINKKENGALDCNERELSLLLIELDRIRDYVFMHKE